MFDALRTLLATRKKRLTRQAWSLMNDKSAEKTCLVMNMEGIQGSDEYWDEYHRVKALGATNIYSTRERMAIYLRRFHFLFWTIVPTIIAWNIVESSGYSRYAMATILLLPVFIFARMVFEAYFYDEVRQSPQNKPALQT